MLSFFYPVFIRRAQHGAVLGHLGHGKAVKVRPVVDEGDDVVRIDIGGVDRRVVEGGPRW